MLSRVAPVVETHDARSAEALAECAFAIALCGTPRIGDERPWMAWRWASILVSETVAWSNGGAVMPAFIWIAVALMLIGAVMLVADIGAPALWIAVITAGIALVAMDRIRARRSLSS